MKTNSIAMIVEGTEYEPQIIKNIDEFFFSKTKNKEKIKLIALPADQNIYMLWNNYNKAGSDSDIIEIIRESSQKTRDALAGHSRNDFGEIYLFMDLDKHQNNLPKGISTNQVITEMLNTFNNETENGKLYISYPMAEAIGDYYKNMCIPISGKCFINPKNKGYKEVVRESKLYKKIGTYTTNDWLNVINTYKRRLSCLIQNKSVLSFEECKEISTNMIYEKQENNKENSIIILSAFPEFLIDYFKIENLDRLSEETNKKYNT